MNVQIIYINNKKKKKKLENQGKLIKEKILLSIEKFDPKILSHSLLFKNPSHQHNRQI
jgi:hypothetical protein